MSGQALIIVDMLNDFVDPAGALYCGPNARKIIGFIQARLADCRRSDCVVIYLQDAHDEDDAEFKKFPKHCLAHSWGSRIIPELEPEPHEKVIPKKRYSGFYGTDLAETLAAAAVSEVEVVGVCTSICVMDTVGGLANRDYKVRVPVAGVADFDARMHTFSLQRMKQIYGADIVT